ncbi:chromate efflux transporter [Vibrio vulnificus]|uniref:chromate efflux transporter n=3 Tax=Vibrio TaxID=662 RepID=UPI0011D18FAC|nr:chromate efflux transporter [Vibrio vulnificus]EHU9439957.1 chromate efflux transporter [Vibrio vulnificus]ELH7530121.1 chromate efflux transporter [Vibrio vulnificus]MCU8291921.1 chromate efflux transporter [Vibrio vulnificus]MCU8371414.1 chromate efflux transporter [Vibrio vulnificus]MCU8569654.1 chromate efflux transporter [Vibrio vulnificus]
MLQIFKTFFWLGWISFGGPAAHIGYFRHTFVEKLKWISDEEYAQLVALSQFLPGPGSSQVGFGLGYKKGGLPGACAAFLGFTLPSVVIMLLLALVSSQVTDTALFQNVVHGLKLLAVVVVADAAWGMYKNFCRSPLTVGICVATAVALLVFSGIATQMAVLILAALIGVIALKGENKATEHSFKPSLTPLLTFAALLLLLPLLATTQPLVRLFNEFYQAGSLVFGGGHVVLPLLLLPLLATTQPLVRLFNEFYQAGSLVFGGGHVVLPLLQNIVGEQISQDAFLTGYAAAQAVPGPMFTFATYIGYVLHPSSPILGAIVATLAVFLPGFLLMLGVLKNWQLLAANPRVSGALQGVNAAVVGLLVAALYQPVFSSAVSSGLDVGLILIGFYLQKQIKVPILALVLFFMLSGATLGML